MNDAIEKFVRQSCSVGQLLAVSLVSLKQCHLANHLKKCSFLKMGQPGLFFVYFWSFRIKIVTIFTTNQCEKMSCRSSIRRWDSNPRASEHEPPRITTRPGLPPQGLFFLGSGPGDTNCSLLSLDLSAEPNQPTISSQFCHIECVSSEHASVKFLHCGVSISSVTRRKY